MSDISLASDQADIGDDFDEEGHQQYSERPFNSVQPHGPANHRWRTAANSVFHHRKALVDSVENSRPSALFNHLESQFTSPPPVPNALRMTRYPRRRLVDADRIMNYMAKKNTRKKTVTFCDSSGAEDSSSSLSNNTQATSIDDLPSDDGLPVSEPKAVSTSAAPLRPSLRRRPQSFSGDGGDWQFLLRGGSRGSSTRISAVAKSEANFTARQAALDLKQTQLTDDLQDAVTQLVALQSEKDTLDREHDLQIKKMERLQQVNSRLRVEINTFHERQAELEHELGNRNNTLSQLKARLETDRQELEDTRRHLADETAQRADANKALAAAKAAHAATLAEVVELAEIKDALAEEQATINMLCDTRTSLEARIVDYEEQIKATRNAKNELHALLTSQIDSLEKIRDALHLRIQNLENQFTDRGLELERLLASQEKLQATISERDKMILELTDEKKSSTAAIQNFTEEIASLKALTADLKGQVNAKDDVIKSLETDSQSVTAARSALETEVGELSAKVTSLEAEKADQVNKETDRIQSSNAALQTQIEELSTELENSRHEIANITTENGRLEASLSEHEIAANEAKDKYTALEKDHKALMDAHEALLREHNACVKKPAPDESANMTECGAPAADAVEALSDVERETEPPTESTSEIARLGSELSEACRRIDNLVTTCTASDDKIIDLRETVTKLQADVLRPLSSHSAPARSHHAHSTISKKSERRGTNRSDDKLLIVRKAADRGRFKVMRRSAFYGSRSLSLNSRRTDDDSG